MTSKPWSAEDGRKMIDLINRQTKPLGGACMVPHVPQWFNTSPVQAWLGQRHWSGNDSRFLCPSCGREECLRKHKERILADMRAMVAAMQTDPMAGGASLR